MQLENSPLDKHKAKERAEIVGSTRKIKKQKGTGTARAGSIKNPIYRGGGRIFGPTVRDYNQKVNKKVKRLARKSALSIKAKQNSILIIEDFHLDAPKTLAYNEVLKAFDLINEKSLVVLGKPNINVYLSSRNLRHSNVITNSELNTYNIINASTLVLFESAIAGIETILNKV